MSRRRSKITWSGPLPHRGDDEAPRPWEESPDYDPGLPPVEQPPRSWMDWWPLDPVESDRWAEETLRTVDRVWRSTILRYHYGVRAVELREEARSWLIEQGMLFRERYIPPVDSDRDHLDTWCAILYTSLRLGAQNYARDVSDHAATYSLDQIDGWATDAPTLIGRRALHGQPLEEMNPERFHLLLETLEHGVDPEETADAKDPDLCIEFGCHRPGTDGGRCASHANHHRRLENTDRCTEEACEGFVYAAGLCTTHYQRTRLSDPNRPRCAEDGCDNPVSGRGYCGNHLRQRRERGLPLPPPQKGRYNDAQCTAEGCTEPPRANDLCTAHYAQQRREGTVCSVDGCDNVISARGYCGTHHQRLLKHGDPLGGRSNMPRTGTCTEPGCTNKIKARGLCSTHYAKDQAARKAQAA